MPRQCLEYRAETANVGFRAAREPDIRPSSTRARVRPVAVEALLDADLVARSVSVRRQDVVYVKGIFEASEGLGAMFAERGGELVIAAPRSRAAELDELLSDLNAEIGAVIRDFVDHP